MVYAIILFAFLFTVIGAVRARRVQLRSVPAYDAMLRATNDAVEMGKAIHVSFGSSALRDSSTIAAIATAEILYMAAGRTLMADRPSYATLSDPITLTLTQNTLRKAYLSRSKTTTYQDTQSRWYPQGEQSLAFAAGAAISTLDEEVSTNILAGRFGSEVALLAENAVRHNHRIIAQSDRIEGQAVAFVVSSVPFIGEELYTSAAYLSREPLAVGSVVAQDVLRYLVIAVLIGLATLAFIGVTFG
jgi:hypothetical protein